MPLPACRYDDVLVSGVPARDWATLVVDTIYRLPKRYAPDDLVSTSKAGLDAGYKVSRVVLGDLRKMATAARDAGTAFAVQSAYRSYQGQATTFAGWVAQSNERQARKVSARPGHSEHQLGTALDSPQRRRRDPAVVAGRFRHHPCGRLAAGARLGVRLRHELSPGEGG